MMGLRETLKLVHRLLDEAQVPHALIGGLALASYGSPRATDDLDLLVAEEHKDLVCMVFEKNGFRRTNSSLEVLQFSGLGYVDILLARRPITQGLLTNAKKLGPEGMSVVGPEGIIGLKIQAYVNDPSRELQDKADIQFLLHNIENLDWAQIWEYADLFNQRSALAEIKKKAEL